MSRGLLVEGVEDAGDVAVVNFRGFNITLIVRTFNDPCNPYPQGYIECVHFPTETSEDVIKRLARLEGQIRGLQRLVDEQAECREIVNQLAAAKGALDRVGFKLMSAALAKADTDTDELEKLFLKLS